MSLSEANIFHLRQILKDFHTKKSAFVDNHRNCVQILCLVGEENEILVRFRYYGEHNIAKLLNKQRFSDDDEPAQPPQAATAAANDVQYNRDAIASFSNAANWKLIVWFQRAQRPIQDICFDPNGRHLLVVCYDNTLHIVPILWIINPEFGLKTTTSQEIENFYWPFRSDEITSFIIPFSGPHECSNSKTCPNNANAYRQTVHTPIGSGSGGDVVATTVTATESNAVVHDKYSPEQINETVLSNNVYQSFYMPASDLKRISGSSYTDATTQAMQSSGEHNSEPISIAEKSPDGCEKRTFDAIADNVADDSNGEPNGCSSGNAGEMKAENVCPFPMSVVWWSTSRLDEQNHQHRAIVGYSDGSICVVGLAPNCPFIANTSIERKCGGILQMTICRDTIVKSVSLLITTTSKEQWKLLLEQAAIGYVFPDEIQKALLDSQSQSNMQSSTDNSNAKLKSPDQDWQFVIPVSATSDDREENGLFESDGSKDVFEQINGDVEISTEHAADAVQPTSGLIPAARARLASLRDLGAKKIGALKLKLIENKIKSTERDRSRQNVTQLVTMHMPSFVPEILTTKTGPFFIAQYLRDTHLLSALHSYSDTLSVHSMDISLIPLYLYKIPKDCTNVLLTPNIMYTTQKVRQGASDSGSSSAADNKTTTQDAAAKVKELKDDEYENKEVPSPIKEAPLVSAIGVIGCNSTVLRIGEDSEFKSSSMLGLFSFPDEKIVSIHRVSCGSVPSTAPVIEITTETNQVTVPMGTTNIGERPIIQQPRVTTQNYVEAFSKDRSQRKDSSIEDPNFFDLDDKSVLEHTFPAIDLDQCLVVTDRSLYMIEFNSVPHIVFLNLVKKSNWKACEEFCKIFNLDYNQCTEYAGDVLLRKNKVTQALLTYNVSRIPAVKTALKLAMFGQNSALMHLCAMALKIGNILKSVHAKSHTINYVMNELAAQQQQQQQHEQQRRTSGRMPSSKKVKEELNCGVPGSDFSYDKDETPSDLQMSNSSQFHLSNLLLLTLTEKTIKDKQMMPLWNFLVVNKRYHTNMSSIVLAQSGLYSSTIVLALNRGAHMDAFCALVGVTNQEFGWYSEINEILYQLSDPIFMECIVYLQSISMDYFDCIQSKCSKINQSVLERLRHQLDPFTAVFRPVVSQLSSNFIESGDLNKKWIEFCKHLIETFLMVIIRLYTLKCGKDETTNGLNTICVRHEQNQFAIKVENGLNISAGFAHCAAIIDGSCYLWGSNGVNCALNLAGPNSVADGNSETSPRCLEFIANMGLEVHAVKCGKAHTMILTNNGLYSMGSNLYQQLGIGKHHVQALQPMLIREFNGKNVTLMEVGQYHNAVYADGELYTFGWGIWGQLGHGDIFTLDRPKRVRFFSGKSIKQIALGHAHTLVLCSNSNNDRQKSRELVVYVFGCNLFGALGTGQYQSDSPTQKCLKSTIPIKINICNETITQIHTKFFTNFVITKSNKLYTWGASPQLIRLLNQSRKRARIAQKCDEPKSAPATDAGGSGEKKFNGDLPNGDLSAAAAGKDPSQQTSELENQQKPPSIDANDGGNNTENVEAIDSHGSPKSFASKLTASNLQDKIKSFLRSETMSRNAAEKSGESEAASKINSEFYLDDEYTEHFLPQQVDTGEVVGQIIQVSSGLYHNVLLTNMSQLYTWGRNLEKQLGRENSRCDLTKPTLLELNENVICIDCGADFTLILTDNLTIKAFGNNNVGQCGREMNIPDRNGYAGKLVRLRVSKRIVRLPDSSQCVEQPIEIPLPRPKIRMNFDAVRYLKSMPKYRPEFISREIFRSPGFAELSPLSENENFEYNSLSSDGEQNAPNVSTLAPEFPSKPKQSPHARSVPTKSVSGDCDSGVTSEFIHYCLYILHGIYDAHKILNFTTLTEFKVRILMLNYYVKEAFALCLSAAKDTIAMHQSQDDVDLDNIMLTSYVIKLFEYFTKDANIVPIHRTDLKYLIQGIFMYFIENSLSMEQLEQYFLNNVDHYLFGLAYVLFFNNNNTKLERQLHKKYSHLFGDCVSDDGLAKNFGCDVNSTTDDGGSSSLNTATGDEGEENECSQTINLAETPNCNTDQNDNNVKDNYDILFNHVSVTFKAIICQRLIKFDKELN